MSVGAAKLPRQLNILNVTERSIAHAACRWLDFGKTPPISGYALRHPTFYHHYKARVTQWIEHVWLR
jgi:hypothetical protein